MVDNGGLITYGIDYYELGYMAARWPQRFSPAKASRRKCPIEYLDASKCSLKVNADTAEALGLDAAELETLHSPERRGTTTEKKMVTVQPSAVL